MKRNKKGKKTNKISLQSADIHTACELPAMTNYIAILHLSPVLDSGELTDISHNHFTLSTHWDFHTRYSAPFFLQHTFKNSYRNK